ncbi:hypothetical protein FA95DRAFT_1585324 [Auriscalpium vulgare]|uniref:Uncharacterized protein n=1 Tax=Auriscalpium vulgare TaxID=40419 RepID=A0ACB8R5T0_9AGAM|nr:hypothetical protein FA95DRAFT_1585324 [Auriscalpium vulgare]
MFLPTDPGSFLDDGVTGAFWPHCNEPGAQHQLGSNTEDYQEHTQEIPDPSCFENEQELEGGYEAVPELEEASEDEESEDEDEEIVVLEDECWRHHDTACNQDQQETGNSSAARTGSSSTASGIASETPHPSPPKLRGKFDPAPSRDNARAALADLTKILRPPRASGIGTKPFSGDELLRRRLEMMALHLRTYTDTEAARILGYQSPQESRFRQSIPRARTVPVGWKASSEYAARIVRKWTRAFLADREALPRNPYGSWNTSLLQDGDLANTIGKYVKAMDIVHFLDQPTIKEQFNIKRTISLATAQRWMKLMDYRWSKTPSGQYVDGHEREDVVAYRQKVFLPVMVEFNELVRPWDPDGNEVEDENSPRPRNRRVVIWFHDESTFYANDRRKTAVPRAKDMVSADYGFLRCPGPDGEKEAARVYFKAGKNREGYFTNDDILRQVAKAMDILDKHYPNDCHIFVFDNATTHQKRADDALSARRMQKFPSENFFVERNVIGSDGKPVYGPDGKILKEKVRMADATLADGTPQPLYFPDDHELAGCFKGMARLLEERGFLQPDFEAVQSLLETCCRSRGYDVVFLPKFHCELNPIEQCWGAAKRKYREFPASSKEADLEENVRKAMESVSLLSMRRFATRARRFVDAYHKGLNGAQAAWAAKKYRGHRVLPNDILQKLSENHIA